jgi:hypothetical protein
LTDQEPERCRNGHLRTPENTMYEHLKNGKTRRRCRICRNLRNRKSAGNSDAIIIGGIELIDNTVYDIGSLPLADRLVVAAFDKALRKVHTKCRQKPREYTDWNADAIDVSEVPSPEYAAKLCAGCPLAELCGESAEVTRPAWGVRNGTVWIYGNKYDKGEKTK